MHIAIQNEPNLILFIREISLNYSLYFNEFFIFNKCFKHKIQVSIILKRGDEELPSLTIIFKL